eukprot:5290018-Alexandrium_andersonii.AAC.1
MASPRALALPTLARFGPARATRGPRTPSLGCSRPSRLERKNIRSRIGASTLSSAGLLCEVPAFASQLAP